MSRPLFRFGLLALCVLFLTSPTTAETQAQDLLIILDASGSMWGQMDGQNKIVIARQVLKDLLADLDESSNVGLMVYGHRREGDCQDVELVAPLGTLDRSALAQTIESINPKGKTPITLSIEQAVAAVKSSARPTTIILVSDGLETCDGSPCAAVRAVEEPGVEFVLHVVGFGIEEGDVSQLECAAQAGGGLYFDVQSADELSAALDQVVEAPVEIPDGRLSVQAIANGELIDVSIRVANAETGKEVAVGRTYTTEETNPRIIPLAEGTYNVKVTAVGLRGDHKRQLEGLEVKDGETVEKVVDFSSGTLSVQATRNGELSDVTVRVYRPGTKKEVAAGRTYVSEETNPKTFELTAGTYDVTLSAVEMTDRPKVGFEGVVVEGQEQTDLSHDFTSGELRIGAREGADLLDVVVSVRNAEAGKEVARGRTYTKAKSNPASWILQPGTYRVSIKPVKREDLAKTEIEVTVVAEDTVEEMVDF